MSEKKLSDIYIIDSEYNIVGFNKTAKDIYPGLREKEKCYQILKNADKPCAVCPVHNQLTGSYTYTDSTRQVTENVDVVEMQLSDGTTGYALVFSAASEELKQDAAIPSRRRKILVVEDNAIDREILHGLLDDKYDILEAEDGDAGLKQLNLHYKELSVILLDLVMAGSTGYDFMERVKRDSLLSSIPIIVMTGDTGMGHEERCLQLGAVEFIQKPYRPAIVKSRIRNIIRMREASASLSTIETDDLTGLYTKQAFLHHARRLVNAHPDTPFDIFIVDIENFKRINRVYGEDKGDEVLKLLAEYVKEHTSDGICARYGADLFVIIKKSLVTGQKAWAKSLMKEFKAQAPVPNMVLKSGIYQNVDRTLSISQMCDRALLALKSIKHNHDRRAALFDGPVSQQLLRSQGYESAFQEAIERKEFVVYYQPKYNPYTEKIVGAEALVRWNHEGKMMPPGEFLKVFEDNGLISQLDEYVFRAVCEYQSNLKKNGRSLIPISVNISRKSMHQDDVVSRYKKIIDENGISPDIVPIEITESAAVGSIEIKPLADAFYEAGFSLHMDDFGSGHSSLNGLNVLHFDVVKFDKSLIDCIGGQRGELLLTYTMALGKELGLHLLAEGVENEDQLSFLMDNGCDEVQGYYYSKPLPVEEFEQKILGNMGQEKVCDDQKDKYKSGSTGSVMKRTVDRMLEHMPGGFFTYEAGGEERILSSNQYLWNLFGCDDEQDFMNHVGGTFRGIVCPEEIDRVEASIRKQIDGNTNHMDYVEYHIVKKDGTKVPVVDYGHLDSLPGGDVFHVFIIKAEK